MASKEVNVWLRGCMTKIKRKIWTF